MILKTDYRVVVQEKEWSRDSYFKSSILLGNVCIKRDLVFIFFFFFLFFTKMLVLRFVSILFLVCHIGWSVALPLQTRGFGSRLLKGVKAKLFSGTGTFYEVGSGSCGEYDTDDELVVAVNKAQMQNGKATYGVLKYFIDSPCKKKKKKAQIPI